MKNTLIDQIKKKRTTKPKKAIGKPLVQAKPKKKKGKVTNINGANQYLLDPRQNKCWELYIDPKSQTFGNALQSAVKAGYEPDYANQITTSEWFKDKLRRLGMLSKAERNLDESLDMPTKTLKVDGNKMVVVTDAALIRIKMDSSKFIASTLGKNEGYSTRHENTGADGKPLFDLGEIARQKLKELE